MPKIKRKCIKGKKVKIAGTLHAPTTHDKNLGNLIEESDIVAIEGYEDFGFIDEDVLTAFLGKEGREKVRKNEIPLTSLDPNSDSSVILEIILRTPVIMGVFSLLNLVSPAIPIAFMCSNLPVLVAYFSHAPNRFVDDKYYWKYVEAEMHVLTALDIPKPSKRDVGMAYGIERLAEEGYDEILSVVGEAHVSKMSKLLDNPEQLKRKFEKYRKNFRKMGLDIYEPKELKAVDFILY